MVSIDLNCDMGEGMGNEKQLMPFISSANIACGYHAGNTSEMQRVIDCCLLHGVAIGAHPSFKDRANFGRSQMRLTSAELKEILLDQLFMLNEIILRQGAIMHHVKPHGALYNMAAADEDLSREIATVVSAFNPSLIVYGFAGSAMITGIQKAGVRVAAEAFADRAYQPSGQLTPRHLANALVTEDGQVIKQVLQLVQERSVTTTGGQIISLSADTICLHGDGHHVVRFASLIHHALGAAGITIKTLE